MGQELFDYAFKTYANRWKFKHPTPEDFFRTMEDASAMDLDWFWRGWFYSTEYVDLGIKDVKQYYVSTEPTEEMKDYVARRGRFLRDMGPFIYLINDDHKEFNPATKKPFTVSDVQILDEYVNSNYSAEEKAALKMPKYFYEVEFNKPGEMIMPIIVQLNFEDGTSETHKFPAQIWRMNNDIAKRVFATDKKITTMVLDPKLETADIDTTNNYWPADSATSNFD